MASFQSDVLLVLYCLRIISPSLVLLLALSLLTLHPHLLPAPDDPDADSVTQVIISNSVPRRSLLLSLLSLSALTFFIDGLSFVVNAVISKQWPFNTALEINALLGLVAFIALALIATWKDLHGCRRVWLLSRVRSVLVAALLLDVAQVFLYGRHLLLLYSSPAVVPFPMLLHFIVPAFRVLVLAVLVSALYSPRIIYSSIHYNVDGHDPHAFEAASSTALLAPIPSVIESTKYGTFRPSTAETHSSNPTTRAPTPFGPAAKAIVKPEITFEPSWSELWRRIRRLSPYLWPSKSPYLQFLAALCVLIVLFGRFVNLAMPLTLAKLVRSLDNPTRRSPWPLLFIYVGLRYLQSSGGLGAVRDALWAPVMQYSDREMSQLSFDHLLNLSFAWHTRRKTGEILRVLDRGVAINRTFELILFNIIPTFIDISIALVAFVFLFEWWLAIVIFLVMLAYVATSVVLTQWRTKIKRQMNERDVATRGIHTDCLLNYETVKYFGGEEYEGARYHEAIHDYQMLEYKVILSLNFLNMAQNAIITIGLLVGSMIVASRVIKGQSDAGDFVLFITYLSQLYGPLNQLGYIYRSINTSLVDTEKLLDLLNEQTEVNDKSHASDLIVNDGEIEFDNVSFSYDGRTTALRGVSFKVPKGSSVALVGESGAGKSTILRLLFRFYDLKEGQGRILVDGQDIREVTQKSLRQVIGVVPQDPILFNSSIAYNIGYGRFGASSEEVVAAAKSAQMHDKIMTFPDVYETRVGERGIRLSGGEKQRVAIARTLLKNPPILLLDEATSALDTTTEKDIQKALQNLMKGRSSLSIAHRLSTIASADIILVIKDGQIVERGTHRELLALDGVFAAMWAEQISTTDEPIDDNASKEPVTVYAIEDELVPAVTSAEILMQPETSSTLNPETSIGSGEVLFIMSSEKQSSRATPGVSGISHVSFPTGELQGGSGRGGSDTSLTNSKTSGLQSILANANPRGSILVTEPVSFAFPSAGGDSKEYILSPSTAAHAVTFENVLPLEHGAMHDLAAPAATEPRRKRISSQNFQRIARRLSFSSSSRQQTSEDSQHSEKDVISPALQTSTVKFDESTTGGHGSRSGTPDPSTEPKRKRISSQNFHKMARRLSISAKKQTSSFIPSIPGLKKDKDKEKERDSGVSTDDSSVQIDESSAGGSLRGKTSKENKVKERKT